MHIKRNSVTVGNGQIPTADLSLQSMFGGQPSASGERVTEQSILSIPAAKAAIEKISTSIARCDCYPYLILDDDGREIDKDHPAYWLLAWKANDWQTSYSWMQTIVADALIHGDGFALYDDGKLYNLPSQDVFPVELGDGVKVEQVFYSVQTRQGQQLYSSDQIIHIRNIALGAGVNGHSLVSGNKTALGMIQSQYTYSAVFFKNGAHLRKVINIPGWLTPEQRKELVDSLQGLKTGVQNANGLTFLFGGATLQTIAEDAEQSQLTESMQGSIIDVANMFNMSSYFLGADQGVSYGSISADTENLLNFSLDPWLTQIEAELSTKLLKYRQQHRTHVIEFQRESLIETSDDYKKQVAALWQSDLMSFEEARARLNLSSKKKGLFFSDKKQEEPKPMMIEQKPTGQNPSLPEEEKPDTTGVVRSALNRIKTRLERAVDNGKTDLSRHSEIIRDSLEGLPVESVFTSIDMLQEEINEVLPEQRAEVIQRWDTECLVQTMLNS